MTMKSLYSVYSTARRLSSEKMPKYMNVAETLSQPLRGYGKIPIKQNDQGGAEWSFTKK